MFKLNDNYLYYIETGSNLYKEFSYSRDLDVFYYREIDNTLIAVEEEATTEEGETITEDEEEIIDESETVKFKNAFSSDLTMNL